jgi:hypothetical protein
LRLGPAPQFVLFNDAKRLSLVKPPGPAPWLGGKPSTVVMQALMPEKAVLLEHSAYAAEAGKPVDVPLFLYNFGPRTVQGRLTVASPSGAKVEFGRTPSQVDGSGRIEIAPGERKRVELSVCFNQPSDPEIQTVRLQGEFSSAGQAVLSLRFLITRGTN